MCTGRPTAYLYEPEAATESGAKKPRRTTTKIVSFLLRAQREYVQMHAEEPSIPHLLFELAHRGAHVT